MCFKYKASERFTDTAGTSASRTGQGVGPIMNVPIPGRARGPARLPATPMKPAAVFLFALSALALHAGAAAQAGRSLGDVRNEMNKGTWEGITLIGKRPRTGAAPASAASAVVSGAAAGASAPGGAGAGAVAAPGARAVVAAPGGPAPEAPPAAERPRSWLGWGEPPSGQPLQAGKRMDAPQGGIALPTAPAGSSPAAPRPR